MSAKPCLLRRGRGILLALLATVLTTMRPASGFSQQLTLSAEVDKAEFFEDEPIYLLARLRNAGTDTAWVTFFSLLTDAMTLSVRRGGSPPARVAKPVVDYVVLSAWRGEPVPPGASFLQTAVLQDIMGDEQDVRSHLYAHHLGPNEYELLFVFHAHAGVPRSAPLMLQAAPIDFRIRQRTTAEDAEVRELEAMRQMGSDTTRVAGRPRAAGYKAALIEWVERRVDTQPDDPFLPFLLSNGLYGVGQILWRHIQSGEVQRFDPDTSEVVSRLRLGLIERHDVSTAGPYLVQVLSARHLDQLAILAGELAATASGDMARYEVARKHPGQTPVQDSLAHLILSLEAQRRAAHLSGNAEQLASILADDFVDIGANGVRRTKQQNVEDTRAHVIQWTSLVAKNEQVQVFDSTAAVVTGEQEGAGTYSGHPFARKTRYLRVYLKRGGRWQNVAAQSALIAP
jgi:uncharacterized protein DUF4440